VVEVNGTRPVALEELTGERVADRAAPARVDGDTVRSDLTALLRDGYVIWERLLSEQDCREIRDAVSPLMDRVGRNNFEGERTQRLYSVLNKTRACDGLVDHPRPLALLDRLLMPNYLLSALQVINILPGESSQLLHHDDGFYPLPRPRPPLGAATIWAIDDFTADNGATVVVPRSHEWGPRTPDPAEAQPVVMPAGSCIFFVGTLWHGGGANRSRESRLAVTAQYCQPWLRTLENFALEVTRDAARSVSEEIQSMLGYSLFPPFVGTVDGVHPGRLLQG